MAEIRICDVPRRTNMNMFDEAQAVQVFFVDHQHQADIPEGALMRGATAEELMAYIKELRTKAGDG